MSRNIKKIKMSHSLMCTTECQTYPHLWNTERFHIMTLCSVFTSFQAWSLFCGSDEFEQLIHGRRVDEVRGKCIVIKQNWKMWNYHRVIETAVYKNTITARSFNLNLELTIVCFSPSPNMWTPSLCSFHISSQHFFWSHNLIFFRQPTSNIVISA